MPAFQFGRDKEAAIDRITEERRRLSAAWLNILAAGVVTAGSVAPLTVLIGGAWTEATKRLAALCLACLLLGIGLHLVARFLIRSSPRTADQLQQRLD